MTWEDAKAALLLLAEEGVGRMVREAASREDAQYEQSKAYLRAEEMRRGPR